MEYLFDVTSVVMKGLTASVKIHAFSRYRATTGTIYENLKLPSTSRHGNLSHGYVKSKKCRYRAFRKLLGKSRKKVAPTSLQPSAKASASDDQSKYTELAVVDCGVHGDAASSVNVKCDLEKLLELPTCKHNNLSLCERVMTQTINDKVQRDCRKLFINDQSRFNKPTVGDNHLQSKTLKNRKTPCNLAIDSKVLGKDPDMCSDAETEKIETNNYSAAGKVLSISRKFVLDKVSLLEDSNKLGDLSAGKVNQWTVSIMAVIERQVSFPGKVSKNLKASKNNRSTYTALVKQHKNTSKKIPPSLTMKSTYDHLLYAEEFQSNSARCKEINLDNIKVLKISGLNNFVTASQSARSLSDKTNRDKYLSKSNTDASSSVNGFINQCEKSSLKPDLKPSKFNNFLLSNRSSRINMLWFYCDDILRHVGKVIYAKLFKQEEIAVKEENNIACSKRFAIRKMLSRKRASLSSSFVETSWQLQPELTHEIHSPAPIKLSLEYTYLGSSNRKNKKILTSVETPV